MKMADKVAEVALARGMTRREVRLAAFDFGYLGLRAAAERLGLHDEPFKHRRDDEVVDLAWRVVHRHRPA